MESAAVVPLLVPWGERHAYVVTGVGTAGRVLAGHFDKALHVSPFLPMDLDYVVTYTAPGDRLLVRGGDRLGWRRVRPTVNALKSYWRGQP